MSSRGAIGVVDSGIGGLSILSKINRQLPFEKLIYVADSGFAPYGSQDPLFIQQRCQKIMDFFIGKNVKAVVLACNTATAAAVVLLREKYSLPIIGLEPAIKPAALQTQSGVIGVLATVGTIDSDKFLNLKNKYAQQVEIITTACPGLVEMIEQLPPDNLRIKHLIKEYTALFTERGGDTLVLGCTHYSLIADLIIEIVGDKVSLIDSGSAVAQELNRRLLALGIVNNSEEGATFVDQQQIDFYSTGELSTQTILMSHYWGRGQLKVLPLS